MLSGTGEMRSLSSGNPVAPAEHGTPQNLTKTMNPGAEALSPSCRHTLCPQQCQADIVPPPHTHTICSVLTFECAMTPCLEHLLPGWCCLLRSSDTLLRSYWWRWVTEDGVFGSDSIWSWAFFFPFSFFASWLLLQCSQPLAVVQQSRWTILLHITNQSNPLFPQVVSCSVFLHKNGNSR